MTSPHLTPAMRRYLDAYITAYDEALAKLTDAPAEEVTGPYVNRAALHATGVAVRTAAAARGGARTDLVNRLRQAGLIEQRHLGSRRMSPHYAYPMYGYVLTELDLTAAGRRGNVPSPPVDEETSR